jgi:glycerol-3-phosphate acyltransferase PlsY
MNPAIAIFAGLFMACALLPVVTSVFLGYRAGERVAISIGAMSGLVLLMSCGFLVWLAHFSELSGVDKSLALAGAVFPGIPALCIFLGNLAVHLDFSIVIGRDRHLIAGLRPGPAGCTASDGAPAETPIGA